jgi:beta-1,4-mannosyl-glycoprotein beta-1,4-N-acetylglucosaminyltransferase
VETNKMIIDAFTFFNELDLLEVRLAYLNDVVDYFVIVESNITHSGNSKPFIFLENKERFSKYSDKIIYSPYIFQNKENLDFSKKPEKFDYNSAHWIVEKNQRNHILNAVNKFNENDLIMISDIDEIPSKDAVKFAANNPLPGIERAAFQQKLYYYNLYTLVNTPWIGTVFTNIKSLRTYGPQWFRDNRNDGIKIPHIYNGGWHFSYFGGVDNIINKLNNTAHQELNRDVYKNKSYIENAIHNSKDLYERPIEFKKVNVDLLPVDLRQYMSAFIHKEYMTVVVPTMWRYKRFVEFLKKLVEHPIVGEIIIINNDNRETPSDQILQHEKIRMFDFGRNIFVNPAWNLGVKESRFNNICILNDDVEFDLTLIDKITDVLTTEKLLGLCPGLQEFNQPTIVNGKIHFEKYTNQNLFGFGCLMFMQKTNWIPIPLGLDIYFGDDWIIETMRARFDQTFLITDLLFFTPYATTTKTLEEKNQILNRERFIFYKEIEKLRLNYFSDPKTVLKNEYKKHCEIETDINQHLPLIKKLADECDDIIEMGVRTGCSTRAFLVSTAKKITSYDLELDSTVAELFKLANQTDKIANYISADVLKLNIEPVDLLFIDTWHSYKQLSQELALHGNKAKKYIVMHDTHTFGVTHNGDDPGLLPAILEFLSKNPQWTVDSHFVKNNGLTVLKRNIEEKNLVIGAAIGYDVDQIKTFVKSFRKFNKTDDMILLVNDDLSSEQKQFFNANNIKAEYFHTAKFLHMWPHSYRFIKILEILQSNNYKNILVSDVRDVVFQLDPFESTNNKLNLFLEDSGVELGKEQINSNWIEQLFGIDTFNTLFNKRIICAGTIIGPSEKVIMLLKLMVEQFTKISLIDKLPVDQALLNYLYHTDKLKSIDCKLNVNGETVGTVGLSVTHELAKDLVEIKNNLVYINDMCPAIVHQYDRSAKLTAHCIQQ